MFSISQTDLISKFNSNLSGLSPKASNWSLINHIFFCYGDKNCNTKNKENYSCTLRFGY